MIMAKKDLILLFLCLILSINPSCKKFYGDEDSGSSSDTPGAEEASDYLWNNSDVITIVLNGTSVEANNSSINVEGSKVTIKSAGTYKITGELTNGQVIVESADAGIVRLILDGANITCSNSAPIYVKKAAKVMIFLTDGTINTIADGSTYVQNDDGEPSAAIFSKTYLSFYGNGTLKLNASFNDGITGKDGMVIKSGKFNVTAADDGIRGKDYLRIYKGDITINSGGDGIKSDNESDPELGYVRIDSANLSIVASDDGISAKTSIMISDGYFNITTGGGAASVSSSGGGTQPGGGNVSGGYNGSVSEKGIKAGTDLKIEKGTYVINSADDALHSNGTFNLNGGELSLSSGDDAIHAETSITVNDGALTILKSYEGIESAAININGGTIILNSTDDAFNATKGLTAGGGEANDGSSLNINGGTLYVSATTGDGIDSNGNLTVTGGTIVVNGPQSQPELAFDVNGTFNISGGFMIGSGPNSGNMIEGPATSSSQYSVKATASSTLSSSTFFHIQDADGKELVTFKPFRATYYLVFSSPDLITGSSYSIYTGGSVTGTGINGLYNGGTYTGGTLKKTFTLSSKLTNVTF